MCVQHKPYDDSPTDTKQNGMQFRTGMLHCVLSHSLCGMDLIRSSCGDVNRPMIFFPHTHTFIRTILCASCVACVHPVHPVCIMLRHGGLLFTRGMAEILPPFLGARDGPHYAPSIREAGRTPFYFLHSVIYCIHSPVGIFNIH